MQFTWRDRSPQEQLALLSQIHLGKALQARNEAVQRPEDDVEEHEMLCEITCDECYSQPPAIDTHPVVMSSDTGLDDVAVLCRHCYDQLTDDGRVDEDLTELLFGYESAHVLPVVGGGL